MAIRRARLLVMNSTTSAPPATRIMRSQPGPAVVADRCAIGATLGTGVGGVGYGSRTDRRQMRGTGGAMRRRHDDASWDDDRRTPRAVGGRVRARRRAAGVRAGREQRPGQLRDPAGAAGVARRGADGVGRATDMSGSTASGAGSRISGPGSTGGGNRSVTARSMSRRTTTMMATVAASIGPGTGSAAAA